MKCWVPSNVLLIMLMFTAILWRLLMFTCFVLTFKCLCYVSSLEPVSKLKGVSCVSLYKCLCSLCCNEMFSRQTEWGHLLCLLRWCCRNKSSFVQKPLNLPITREGCTVRSSSVIPQLYCGWICTFNWQIICLCLSHLILWGFLCYFIHLVLFLLNLFQAFFFCVF